MRNEKQKDLMNLILDTSEIMDLGSDELLESLLTLVVGFAKFKMEEEPDSHEVSYEFSVANPDNSSFSGFSVEVRGLINE